MCVPRLPPFLRRLDHGNGLERFDAIAIKYPEGRFDCICAEPSYSLSNADSFRACRRSVPCGLLKKRQLSPHLVKAIEAVVAVPH